MTASIPAWARLTHTRAETIPWATVATSESYGRQIVRVLSIGRGWVSVVAETYTGPQTQVWQPSDLSWESARLMPGCLGVVVELDGATHQCHVAEVGEARVWQWVRRAVEVEASVSGVF